MPMHEIRTPNQVQNAFPSSMVPGQTISASMVFGQVSVVWLALLEYSDAFRSARYQSWRIFSGNECMREVQNWVWRYMRIYWIPERRSKQCCDEKTSHSWCACRTEDELYFGVTAVLVLARAWETSGLNTPPPTPVAAEVATNLGFHSSTELKYYHWQSLTSCETFASRSSNHGRRRHEGDATSCPMNSQAFVEDNSRYCLESPPDAVKFNSVFKLTFLWSIFRTASSSISLKASARYKRAFTANPVGIIPSAGN